MVVIERSNALHTTPRKAIDLVVADLGWTKQSLLIPAALKWLKPKGRIISLIKPHYEAEKSQLKKGILPQELVEPTVKAVEAEAIALGLFWIATTPSPIKGAGGNTEVLALLKLSTGF